MQKASAVVQMIFEKSQSISNESRQIQKQQAASMERIAAASKSFTE